jgi:GntR family transcriptional regulator / MocR family aminotransferase
MKTALTLDAKLSLAGVPLTKQIGAALVNEIRRGRLRAGAVVPSSRALAESLGVHRNTVLAAYDELIGQGYLETEKARGTFVSARVPADLPAHRPRASRKVPLDLAPSRLVLPRSLRPGDLPLLGGLPDLREFPREALHRAYRASLKRGPEVLDYAGSGGHPRLIASTLEYLRTKRGLVSEPTHMVITRGSQQALFLAAKALIGRRTVMAVEAAGYPPAWESFRLAGAQLVPISIDSEGLVVSELEKLVEKTEIAAVYVTAHHQYPTTVSLSGPRRLELLRLAEKARFVIIEDDYDHEFHFEGHPIFPLARDDEAELVLHIGTFSKVFAPGLRIGYAVGREELVERMKQIRLSIDRQGDAVLELAVAQMMEDGDFDAHVRRMFRLYEQRRTVFYECLRSELGHVLGIDQARGGLATWVRVERRISAEEWALRAYERGVHVQPGSLFSFDSRKKMPFLRLGFSRLNEHEIVDAIGRLKKALPKG